MHEYGKTIGDCEWALKVTWGFCLLGSGQVLLEGRFACDWWYGDKCRAGCFLNVFCAQL